MEGHTFLSWNIPNLITVWTMALLLGVALYGLKRLHAAKTASA